MVMRVFIRMNDIRIALRNKTQTCVIRIAFGFNKSTCEFLKQIYSPNHFSDTVFSRLAVK